MRRILQRRNGNPKVPDVPDAIHEREYYVAKVYRDLGMQTQLQQRWESIGYQQPEARQMKLF